MTSSSEEWIIHSFTMKHCLTVINHGRVPIDPLKATLVTVTWRLIVALVSLRLQWGLARVLCGMSLTPQYRHFSQMTLWSHGNEPQSQWGKAKTTGSQSTLWLPSCQESLPGLSACPYGRVNTCCFLEYWPTSGNFSYQKYLEYVSETWQDYCLDVWVSVFKRISL